MGPSFLWGISKERNLFLEELEYRIIFTYIHQQSICVKCSNFLENCKLDEKLKFENLDTKKLHTWVKNDTIDDKNLTMQIHALCNLLKLILRWCNYLILPSLGEGKVAKFPKFSFIVQLSKNSNVSQINWLLVKTLNILKMVSKLPRQVWSSPLWKNGS